MAVLLVERKRYWSFDSFTTAGYLPGNITKKNQFIKPIVWNHTDASNNTHCLSKVGSKITLFSERISNANQTCIYLNGYFFDETNYKAKIKLIRTIKKLMAFLKVGFVMWKTNSLRDDDNAMIYYDYNNSLPKIKLDDDEKKIFETRTVPGVSMSRKLYTKLLLLKEMMKENEGEPAAKKIKLA
jgi:hypothetical protein